METLAFWRNVALVILAFEGLVVLVLALALNYGLVRLLDILHGLATRYSRKAQEVSRIVAERTDAYADKAKQPVIAGRAQVTRLRVTVLSMIGGRGSRPAPPSASVPHP